MKKTLILLSLIICLIALNGCSDFDNEYQTVFKQNHYKMDPKTPFQESTKKNLEKIDKLNADMKGKLDLSSLSLKDFNDNSLFKDSVRMASLKEAIKNHEQYFKDYWDNYFEIINNWEAEVEALNEGDNPQFSEDFYKAFKKDFDRYRLRMENIKFSENLYFKWFNEFIDFMNIGSNYFFDDGKPIFYNSSNADECLTKLYKATSAKHNFFKKIEYLQDLWASNLLISKDFNNLESIDLQCFPASGITGEDNYKRHTQTELQVSTDMQQMLMKWEEKFKEDNNISVMSIKFF